MDILTTVKLDHKNIDAMLQKLIESMKKGGINHIMLEDFFEEITEHIQAEKVCLSELLNKKELEIQPSSLINDENILKILSQNLYGDNLRAHDKDLKSKLHRLRIQLLEHSQHVENVIQQLSRQGLNDQESEELSAKFEQEKLSTLLSTITYA